MSHPPPAAIDRGDDIAALDADIPQEMIGELADMQRVMPALPPPHHAGECRPAGRQQE